MAIAYLEGERQFGTTMRGAVNATVTRNRGVASLLLLGTWIVACSGCISKTSQPALLIQESSHSIAGGESLPATIRCRGNELTLLRAHQDNVDVTVELVDGIGTESQIVDFPSGRFGDEYLAFTCGTSESHSIVVKNKAKSVPGGSVQIFVYGLNSTDESTKEAYRQLTYAGRMNFERGDNVWPRVVQALSAARNVWRSTRWRYEEASTEFALGYVCYMNQNNWTGAVQHATTAETLFSTLGDVTGEATALTLRGAALEEAALSKTSGAKDPETQRMFIESEELLTKAELLQVRNKRMFDAAMSRNYRAINLHYRDENTGAVSEFEAAEKQFATLLENPSQRMVLQNLATINYQQGNYGDAKAQFARLLPMMDKDDDPYLYATTLQNSARVLSATGNMEDALSQAIEALEVQRQRRSRAGEARALYIIGVIYQRLSQYDRALFFLDKSLAIDMQELKTTEDANKSSHNQRRQVLATLVEMGNINRTLGNHKLAEEDHLRALQFAASDVNRARVELAVGSDLAAAGEPEKAMDWFAQAQSRASSVTNPYMTTALVAHAKALRDLGQPRNGLPLLERAAAIAEQNSSEIEAGIVYGELAATKEALLDRAGALAVVKKSIAKFERLRMQLSSPELRAVALASQRNAYRQWVSLLLSLNATDSGHGGATVNEESLLAAEQSRSRSLVGQWQNRKTQAPESGKLLDSEKYFDELSGKRAALDALLDKTNVDESRIAAIQEDIRLLRAKIEVSEGVRRTADAQSDAEIMSVSQLRKLQRNIPPACVFVEYLLTSSTSWAWVVGTNGIEVHPLPGKEKIDALVETVRRQLRTQSSHPELESAIQGLATAVLHPALSGAEVECVVIVPDGSLQYVPFGLLAEALPRKPSHPLSILIAPSLNLIARSGSRIGSSYSDARVAVFAPQYSSEKSAHPDSNLRSVFAEIGAIKASYGTDRVHIASTTEVTRSGFMQFDFGLYQIVHIAAHGIVDTENGGLSRFVISNLNDADDSIRAHDISRVRLGSALVVLSACETGLGQAIDGEGLVGFANAFIGAGANAIVMSLWRIPDEATGKLMSYFYEGLSARKLSPERALLFAQQKIRASEKWSHPYFWSGFEILATHAPSNQRIGR